MTPLPHININRRMRRRPNPLGVCVFMISLFVLSVFWMTSDEGVWAMCFDGEPVAVAESAEVERALEQIETQYGPLTDEQRARVKVVRVSEGESLGKLTANELQDRLVAGYGFVGTGVGLRIDGDVKMVFENRQDAVAFLDELKATYAVEPDSKCSFVESVDLVEVEASRAQMVDREGAWRIYKSRTKDDIEYKIKDGDTLWDIALAHQMSVAQLLKANPGIKEDSILDLGSSLIISKQDPLLTVVATAEVTETREIPYQVTVQRDTSLPMGQRKVVEPGKPGKEEVTYEVTRQNGRLVERVKLASTEIEPPKTQVEVRGAMLMVASRSGGQLAWPVRGSISSPFGMRYGRMHTGVDIAASHGTPIGAAESGRVVQAGWGGGYGRMVDIDHGGGVVTRYAHMTSIAVSVGKNVERGELIGYVGSTGRSTGPHLHFEVIVNGRQLNPMNYL